MWKLRTYAQSSGNWTSVTNPSFFLWVTFLSEKYPNASIVLSQNFSILWILSTVAALVASFVSRTRKKNLPSKIDFGAGKFFLKIEQIIIRSCVQYHKNLFLCFCFVFSVTLLGLPLTGTVRVGQVKPGSLCNILQAKLDGVLPFRTDHDDEASKRTLQLHFVLFTQIILSEIVYCNVFF